MAPKTSSETFRYFKRFSALERTESAQSVAFRIGDEITFEGRKLNDLSKEVDMTTNSFTKLNQQGRLTFGYAISRQLGHASTSDAGAVNLVLGNGSLSVYIRSLKLGKMLKYE